MNEHWIKHPTILNGKIINLLPLEEKYLDTLFAAAADKRIWDFYTGDWSVYETFIKTYKNSLQQRDAGAEYPFVIFHKPAQKIIGSTRFLDITPYDRKLEIGGTWLMPQYWGTAVNLDCKLILLTFCFQTLKTKRVQLKTQHDNIRSRRAIEKIGGIYEGTLREHILKDNGTFRSSAYFSILDYEWETVKINLHNRLHALLPITNHD